MPPVAGAQNLGTARGSIEISTADLARVQATTRQVGRDVSRNLGQIDMGAKRAQASIGGLTSSMGGLVATFGVTLGAGLIAQMGRLAIQADAMSTAYERQSVAALSLAGSQEKLNELLATYSRVTGGAVDQATALGDVTRLQAVGFADSAQELEQFAIAARGISVAMGAQQDYVIGQLQLAIANQSTMRLDQIGLGVSEVMNRIRELQAADSSLTKEMAYQNAVLGIALEKYGALAISTEAQATGAEKAAKAWKELQLQIGESVGPTIDAVTTSFANLFDTISTGFQKMSSGLAWFGDQLGALGQTYLPEGFRQRGLAALNSMGYSLPSAAPAAAPNSSAATPSAAPRGPSYTDEQTAAIRQWARDVADIERQAGQARLDATRQYEQQRADTIRNYGKSIVREEEDFARNRARAIRDYGRQVAQVHEDAAKREATWQRDYNDRAAELRQDGNERLQEIEERFNRDRERAQQTHRDRLMDAAARLDAVAVRNEQRNYARQQQDAEENYEEQRASIRDVLEEQLADAVRAQEERLQDARAADAERLADMQAAFDERLATEDSERAIMMARRDEDHAAQLAEMERSQAERMAKINEQTAREKASLEQAFIEQLNDLGLHNAQWLAMQKSKEEASIASFGRWWDAINKRIDATIQGPVTEANAWPTSFAVGQAPAIGPSLAGGNRSVTIAEGAVQVYGAPGQSEAQLGRIVRDEMIGLLEGVGN